MKNISALWNIEPKTFYILAATLTFAVIGTTQALKGKLGKLPARWICFILSVICAVMQNVIPSSQVTKQAYGQAFKSGITGGSDGNGYNRVRVENKQLFFSATLMALSWIVDVNKL